MNKTHFEHAAYATIMQAAIGLLTGNWWAGAAAGGFFFLGREHAQREYKVGDPSKLKGYKAFDVWRWSRDAQLDLVCPVVATLIVSLIVSSD